VRLNNTRLSLPGKHGGLTVAREGPGAIDHNGVVVEIAGWSILQDGDLLKLVVHIGQDVAPLNVKELVPVVPHVLMIQANGVAQLVQSAAQVVATVA